ncbi:MAG: hypothetical protein ACO38X_05185 [bacterium]
MKVAVLGSGGREHALVWKLSQSPRIKDLFCVPGNPGIAQLAKCVPLSLDDHQSLILWAKKEEISLTVVGPEDPLSNGIVDSFQAAGIKIYGPNQKAAQLESSKTFAKQITHRIGRERLSTGSIVPTVTCKTERGWPSFTPHLREPTTYPHRMAIWPV